MENKTRYYTIVNAIKSGSLELAFISASEFEQPFIKYLRNGQVAITRITATITAEVVGHAGETKNICFPITSSIIKLKNFDNIYTDVFVGNGQKFYLPVRAQSGAFLQIRTSDFTATTILFQTGAEPDTFQTQTLVSRINSFVVDLTLEYEII